MFTIYEDLTNPNNLEVDVVFFDQVCTDEDRDELWNKHKILYVGSIMAIKVIEREKCNPLMVFLGEDDGHLFVNERVTSSTGWLDDYIKTLTELKKRLK